MLISCTSCDRQRITGAIGDARCDECGRRVGGTKCVDDDEDTPVVPSMRIRRMIDDSVRSMPPPSMWTTIDTASELAPKKKLELVLEEEPMDVSGLVEKNGVLVDPEEEKTEETSAPFDSAQIPLAFDRPKTLPPPRPPIRMQSLLARPHPRRRSTTTVRSLLFGAAVLGVVAIDLDLMVAASEQRSAITTTGATITRTFATTPPLAPAAQPESTASASPVIEIDETPIASATPAKPSASTPVRSKAEATTPPRTDAEAMTEQADRAFARREWQAASDGYESALLTNPRYLPARLGVADTAWARGDRAAATKAYDAIAEAFPSSLLPARVSERASAHPTPQGEDSRP